MAYDRYISDGRVYLGMNYIKLEKIYDIFSDIENKIDNIDKETLIINLKDVHESLQEIRKYNLNALAAINGLPYTVPNCDLTE
jgi:hypothetical protein